MREFKIQDGVLLEYYGEDQEVFVPEGVTEIGSYAFVERHNTVVHKRVIHLPDSLKKIGESAFSGCTYLEEVNMPAGVEEIGGWAFHECSSLKRMTLPRGVTDIPKGCFAGCFSLQSIQISPEVRTMGEVAFARTKLAYFELPPGIERIHRYVFAYCENLKKVVIPKSVTEISEDAFVGMSGEICVEEGNPVYSSEEGALYRDGGKTLMHAPMRESGEYTVPPQVEHIAPYALACAEKWKKVTLHGGIKSIGDEAIPAYRIHAPVGTSPEHVGKNIFSFSQGSQALFFSELPVDYVAEEALRHRLALGYCLDHASYAPEYAANYEAYIRKNLEALKRKANKMKMEEVQKYLASMEADMPLEIPADCSKLKPVEKVELLENMVLRGDVQQIEAVMKACRKFEFTARALGMACRYRTLDVVKVLVENGADFKYEQKPSFKTRYAAAIKTSYAYREHWASYELLLVYTGMNPVIPSIHASAYDVHFGGMPLISMEENTPDERAKIVKYLMEKEAICASYVLIHALMWGCRHIAEQMLESGAAIDAQHDAVRGMLTGSCAADDRSEMLTMLSLLSEEDCAFAIRQYGEAAEKAGVKIVLPKKLFDEEDSVFLKGKVLSQIVRFADTRKLSKTAILEAVTLRNDVQALDVLAQAGWLARKAQVDQLIELAGGHGCVEAAAWLMNHMNQTMDIARETEKEERKAMRALNANPNSVTALKKIWLFKMLENGKLQITGYKGDALEIEVPARIGKDEVYAIGEEAFSPLTYSKTVKNKACRAKIETIVIPEGIAEIGREAFDGCSALRAVQLPSTLVSIGDGAFRKCTSLAGIHLPDRLKDLGRDVFEGCSSLECVNIPKRTKAVSRDMFEGCEKLLAKEGLLIIDGRLIACTGTEENIVVPEGVTEIADSALNLLQKDVSAIKEIHLPDSLVRIGAGAFSGQEFETIEIPDSVKEIGSSAFSECRALSAIRMPGSVTRLAYGTFSRCVALRRVELPQGLKKIEDEAFLYCRELKEITIPRGVTEIGWKAFRGSGLENLFIPDTVKRIDDCALSDMLNLRDLWLPGSIKEMDHWFLGQINTDEVRIHVIRDSQTAKSIWYKNLVYDYPENEK